MNQNTNNPYYNNNNMMNNNNNYNNNAPPVNNGAQAIYYDPQQQMNPVNYNAYPTTREYPNVPPQSAPSANNNNYPQNANMSAPQQGGYYDQGNQNAFPNNNTYYGNNNNNNMNPNYSNPIYGHNVSNNVNRIRVVRARLQKFSDRSKFLDHPTIPRVTLQDIQNDIGTLPSGPVGIVTTPKSSFRATFNTIPKNTKAKNLEKLLDLPVGVTIRPMYDKNLPEADFSQVGNHIIRCKRCKSYINPFTTFVDNGAKWQCILCKHLNETPRPYYCALDRDTGKRLDIEVRPELKYCSLDLLATPEFLRTAPLCPVILFMLDCSYAAVSSGVLSSVCQGVLYALEELKDNDALHMSVVGFDNTVYLFNFEGDTPRMVVAPDIVNDLCNINDRFKVEPIELPNPMVEFVVPVKNNYEKLRTLFESLPQMFANTKEVGCAFGGALAAASTLLHRSGGKIISSISSIPSVGEGKLKHRFDVQKMCNTTNEYTMCGLGTDWYKQRALVCANSNISFDIIANGFENIDLATIAPLVRYTSGNIIRITKQNINGLQEQVAHMVSRACAFDSVLRIRCSYGLVVKNFYGHCHVKEPELLVLPIGTEDASYSIELDMQPEFKAKYVYVQIACVYVNQMRERRVRLHTVQLGASDDPVEVINSIDCIGMSSFLCKLCVDYTEGSSFEQAQNKINDKIVNALRFTQNQLITAGEVPGAGEMMIPESIKFLPQIMNGFFRQAAVCSPNKKPMMPDERIASMSTIIASPPESLLFTAVTFFYAIYIPGREMSSFPLQMNSSMALLSEDSIYFINLGSVLVLWYGKNANQDVLQILGLIEAADNGQTMANAEELNALRERTEALMWDHKMFCTPFYCAALEPLCDTSRSEVVVSSKAFLEDDYMEGKVLSYSNYLLKLWQKMNSKA